MTRERELQGGHLTARLRGRTMGRVTPPTNMQVPWDVVGVSLVGTPHTIMLARVWLDVLADASVNHDSVRNELVAALDVRPSSASQAAGIARESHVRDLPATEQAAWLVDQVRALSGLAPLSRPGS